MAGGRELDTSRLKALALHLSRSSAKDEGFGMVKLNKLLYRADFEAYRRLGHSLTGETYEKQEWGPVARHLPIMLDELRDDGWLAWQFIPRGPYTRKVPTPKHLEDHPGISEVLNEDELQIVEDTLKELARHGGKSVSVWSHEESAGWRVSEIGEAIPYESSLIASGPAPKEAVARLRERVLSGNWD